MMLGAPAFTDSPRKESTLESSESADVNKTMETTKSSGNYELIGISTRGFLFGKPGNNIPPPPSPAELPERLQRIRAHPNSGPEQAPQIQSGSGREHSYSARRKHHPYRENDQSYYMPATRMSGSGRSYSSRSVNRSYDTHFLPAPRFVGGHGPGEKGFAGMSGPAEDGPPTTPAAPSSFLPSLHRRFEKLGKLDQNALIGEKKMILIMCLDNALVQIIREDPSVMAYEGVIQIGNSCVKMRPYLKEMLTKCSNRYEFILFCDFPTPFVEDFVRQNMEIAELCKMRIFSKDDVRGKPAELLLNKIPRESFDFILSLVISSRQFPGVRPVYVTNHHLFHKNKRGAVSPGAVRFSRQYNTKIPCPDEDKKQLRRTASYLIEIHNARFGREGRPGPPAVMQPILKKCADEVYRDNRPRCAPPSKQQTIDKMMALSRDQLEHEKKMILLVDLDNTIMNACPDPIASRMIGALPLFGGFQLKIRPGAVLFLQECAKQFELIVVTMGTKDYATDIIALLDKDKKLFKNRIISRDDLKSKHYKEEVFSYFQSAARELIVIIDDSDFVWKYLKWRHLIKVKPYQVFHSGYAFDEETTMQVLKQEKETGQIARVQAEDTDNNYLNRILLGQLRELHCLYYHGDECDPRKVQHRLTDMHIEREKKEQMRRGCSDFKVLSAEASSTCAFPTKVKKRKI